MLRLASWSERAFCFFAVNAFMSAYVALPLRISGVTFASGEQNPWYTAMQVLVLLGTAVLCALSPGRVLAVAARATLLNYFILLAALSVAWSIAPLVSLRRVVTLTTAAAFAYYLVATRPVDRIIRIIALAAATAAVASAVVALAAPEIGLMKASEVENPQLAGAWTGVFTHKNELGADMVLGTQACAWLAMVRPRRRLLPAFGALICFAVAFQTRSETAEISILVTPLLFCGLRILRLPGLALLWAWAALAAVFLLSMAVTGLFFDEIMDAIGKDASLTGRLPLWSELTDLSEGRLLQGYGYMAFFVAGNSDMDSVQRAIGWDAPEAHQAYLEVLLQLGIPGLVLAVALLAHTVWLSLAAVRAGVPWAGLAAVVMLTFAGAGMVETVLLRAGNIYALLLPLFYAAVRVHQAYNPEHPRAAPLPAEEWTMEGRQLLGAPWRQRVE